MLVFISNFLKTKNSFLFFNISKKEMTSTSLSYNIISLVDSTWKHRWFIWSFRDSWINSDFHLMFLYDRINSIFNCTWDHQFEFFFFKCIIFCIATLRTYIYFFSIIENYKDAYKNWNQWTRRNWKTCPQS